MTGGPVGKAVQSVGVASGRKTGNVTETNANYQNPNNGVMLLWQDSAYFGFPGTTGGDSGSPVFEIYNQSTNDVLLNGTLWLKSDVYSVFSDINYIRFQQELPGLVFCTAHC